MLSLSGITVCNNICMSSVQSVQRFSLALYMIGMMVKLLHWCLPKCLYGKGSGSQCPLNLLVWTFGQPTGCHTLCTVLCR